MGFLSITSLQTDGWIILMVLIMSKKKVPGTLKKVMHYPISFRPHSSSNPPSWIRPSPTPSTSSFATSLELSTLRLSPTNRRQSQSLWRLRNFVQTCVWWRSECFEAFDQNLNGPRVERSCHLLFVGKCFAVFSFFKDFSTYFWHLWSCLFSQMWFFVVLVPAFYSF